MNEIIIDFTNAKKKVENFVNSKRCQILSSRGIDIKKEIIIFKSKNTIKKPNKMICENKMFDSKFLNLNSNENKFTKDVLYVKNKLIMLENINKSCKSILTEDRKCTSKTKKTNKLNGHDLKLENKSNFLSNTGFSNKFDKFNHKIANKNQIGKKNVKSFDLINDNFECMKDNSTSFNFNKSIKNKNSLLSTKFGESTSIEFMPDVNSRHNSNIKNSSSSMYQVLAFKRDEFIKNMSKKSDNLIIQNLLIQKKNFLKNNLRTYYMKKQGGSHYIPLVFPIALIHQNNYTNISEKHRYERISQHFLRLKYFIENDQKNEFTYIKEFMMNHHIYDEELYCLKNLNNFSKFLNSNIKINPSMSIREVITDACNYRDNDEMMIEK